MIYNAASIRARALAAKAEAANIKPATATERALKARVESQAAGLAAVSDRIGQILGIMNQRAEESRSALAAVEAE